ncbi:MAG: hypothetical protein QN159_03060 [Armatimonadota bacterium]|nr:hypothetical protein [Armatimonadota bacterium]
MAGPLPPDPPPRRPKIVEALLQDFNLIGLGGIAALALLTGSPIPLIVGGAVEALYLINAPGSAWFERYLAVQRARRRGRRREAWRARTLAALPRADRERFRATQRRLAAARDRLDGQTRALAASELDRVDDLLDQMLDLLAVRLAARAYLATIDAEALVDEMQAVRRRVRADDHPDLARVEAQRLEVLEKRLGEMEQMQRNVEIVTSQIATVEHSIAYLADKLVSWSAAGRQPQGLKEILAGVESTEQAIEEVKPVMEQIQRVRHA